MFDTPSLLEHLNSPMVACNAAFIITYANTAYRQMILEMTGADDFVGKHMADCHQAKSMELLERLFAEFRKRERKHYCYKEDFSTCTLTFIIVPLYNDTIFDGAVEFVFEGLSL